MSAAYCPACGEMDYSAFGDRPCACSLMAEQLCPSYTQDDECRGNGHPYYGNEADCNDGALHAADEVCLCGRCYCGEVRYSRSGAVRPAPAVAPAPTDVDRRRVGGASGATGFAKDNPVGAQFRPGRRGAGSARNGR